jgi:hypothetical protein
MSLPRSVEAELDRLGLPKPRPVLAERTYPPVWKPAYPGQEPPF